MTDSLKKHHTMSENDPTPNKTTRSRRKPNSKKDPLNASDSEQDGGRVAPCSCSGKLSIIDDKLDKILASSGNIEARLSSLELKYQQVSSNTLDIADLKTSVTFVHETHDVIKSQINKKSEYNLRIIRSLEDNIDDIQNRSRRNSKVCLKELRPDREPARNSFRSC